MHHQPSGIRSLTLFYQKVFFTRRHIYYSYGRKLENLTQRVPWIRKIRPPIFELPHHFSSQYGFTYKMKKESKFKIFSQYELVKESVSFDMEWIPFSGPYWHHKTRILAASFCTNTGGLTTVK
jgi:hypothetical protein